MTNDELRAKCQEVINQPNREIEPYICKICGDMSSRAHYVASHILLHLRQLEACDAQKEHDRFSLIELD